MKKDSYSGFTAIETIIATSIIVVIASVVFQLLTGGQMSYSVTESKMEAQERARIALEQMVQELRQAHPQFVYIKYSTDQGAPNNFSPIQIGTNLWEGDSILFRMPCRNVPSGTIALNPINGLIIYGTQNVNGSWQDDLWIEYAIVPGLDVVQPAPPPLPPPPPPPLIIWPNILLPDAWGQPPVQSLRRRVWNESDVNLTSLEISPGAVPEHENILTAAVDSITFRTNKRVFPDKLEIAIVGRGWSSSRREELTSLVESGITFRNKSR